MVTEAPIGEVTTREGNAFVRNELSGFLSTIKYWMDRASPSLNFARKAFFCPDLVNVAPIANEIVPSASNGPLSGVVSVFNKTTG